MTLSVEIVLKASTRGSIVLLDYVLLRETLPRSEIDDSLTYSIGLRVPDIAKVDAIVKGGSIALSVTGGEEQISSADRSITVNLVVDCDAREAI